MDLSIIIVSWNCRERLKENLYFLMQSRDLSHEIFVVDNNSDDATVEMLRSEFPQIHLVANQENLGFAKANNQALRLTQGDFVLLLNPDMKLAPDSLSRAVAWLKAKPEAGVAGFRLLNQAGEIIKQVRCFPTLLDQLAIVLKIPHLIPSVLNKYILADFDYNHDTEVDSIRGSYFFIRRQTLEKLGYLDERFFLWFEEVDYCRRVWQSGVQVWYSNASQATDYVGKSFQLLPRKKNKKYFRDSQIKYFAKWHPT